MLGLGCFLRVVALARRGDLRVREVLRRLRPEEEVEEELEVEAAAVEVSEEEDGR